jgi:putative nucleotidyltransferase with HDIG domain
MTNLPPKEDIRSRLLAARLPSPPQTLLKLLSLCQSDDVAIAELSELIANDAGMTAKVLSVAHSAAYHRADTQTLTLLQATSMLGTALIKVLVISESVFQTFNTLGQAGGANLRIFWKHSLSVALIARELAALLDMAQTEEAYLAGLLHDIGRLALLTAAPQRCLPMFGALDDQALCAVEKQSLEISHTEAGAWLLGRWHLSGQIVDSVLNHHADMTKLANVEPLTRIIHLAHRLAALPLNDAEAVASFVCEQGLQTSDIVAITQKAALDVEKVARDLGIDISTADIPSPQETPPAALEQPQDAVQTQLTKDILDRSVLNEMAMTLISVGSTQMAMTSLRHHASALLQLEDAVVMVLRDNPQMLVPVSMNKTHRSESDLSFGVAANAPLTECVSQRKVVFSDLKNKPAHALMDFLSADELVLIPLLTTQHCLGVLAAAVPANLSEHLRSQTPMLQAFGLYAGLAISRRNQSESRRKTRVAIAKQEQQLELAKLADQAKKLLEQLSEATHTTPMTSIDLCQATQDMVQLLRDSRSLPESIDITCHVTGRATLIHGSPEMVKQIVLILVKKACDRMLDGGQISVDAGTLIQRTGAMYTLLTVSDTGEAAQKIIQAELYEPQPHGKINGPRELSLSSVNQLVDKMSGHLKFSSGPSGTRFDILFPCTTTA